MKSKLAKMLGEPSSSGEPAAKPTPPPTPEPVKPASAPKAEPKVNDALRAARSKRKGTKNDDKKPSDGGAGGFNLLRPGTWSRGLW